MSDPKTPEMKNSDAPGDQDQDAQESPVLAEGLSGEAEKETEESDGGYGR